MRFLGVVHEFLIIVARGTLNITVDRRLMMLRCIKEGVVHHLLTSPTEIFFGSHHEIIYSLGLHLQSNNWSLLCGVYPALRRIYVTVTPTRRTLCMMKRLFGRHRRSQGYQLASQLSTTIYYHNLPQSNYPIYHAPSIFCWPHLPPQRKALLTNA